MKAKSVELVCALQSLKPMASEVTLLGDAATRLVRSDPAVLRHTLQALVLAAEGLLKTSRDCQYMAGDVVRFERPRLRTTAELKSDLQTEKADA